MPNIASADRVARAAVTAFAGLTRYVQSFNGACNPRIRHRQNSLAQNANLHTNIGFPTGDRSNPDAPATSPQD